jgi:hypothetical protein
MPYRYALGSIMLGVLGVFYGQRLAGEVKYLYKSTGILVWEYVPLDGGIVVVTMQEKKGLLVQKYDKNLKLQWEKKLYDKHDRENPASVMVVDSMVYFFTAVKKGDKRQIYLYQVGLDQRVYKSGELLFEVIGKGVISLKIRYSPNRQWGAMFVVYPRLIRADAFGFRSPDTIAIPYFAVGPKGFCKKAYWSIPNTAGEVTLYEHPMIDNEGAFYLFVTFLNPKTSQTDYFLMRYILSVELTLKLELELKEKSDRTSYLVFPRIHVSDTTVTLAILMRKYETSIRRSIEVAKTAKIWLIKVRLPGFFIGDKFAYGIPNQTPALDKVSGDKEKPEIPITLLRIDKVIPISGGKTYVLTQVLILPYDQSICEDYDYDLIAGYKNFRVYSGPIYIFSINETTRSIDVDKIYKRGSISVYDMDIRERSMISHVFMMAPYYPSGGAAGTADWLFYSLFQKDQKLYFLYVLEGKRARDPEKLCLRTYDMTTGQLGEPKELVTDYDEKYLFMRYWTKQLDDQSFLLFLIEFTKSKPEYFTLRKYILD